jgi:hypothetical protein
MVMLYIITSTIKLQSETLPQWAPLIIDTGLGTSFGLQNISVESRNLIFNYIRDIVGTMCGGVQLLLHGSRLSRSPSYEREPLTGEFQR